MECELEEGTYLRSYYGTWYRVSTVLIAPTYQHGPVAYAFNVDECAPEDGVYKSLFWEGRYVVRNSSVDVFNEFEYLLLKATEHAEA